MMPEHISQEKPHEPLETIIIENSDTSRNISKDLNASKRLITQPHAVSIGDFHPLVQAEKLLKCWDWCISPPEELAVSGSAKYGSDRGQYGEYPEGIRITSVAWETKWWHQNIGSDSFEI